MHSLLLFLSFLSLSVFSQTKKPDAVYCDCAKARELKINGNQKIGMTLAPLDSGTIQEISPSKLNTKYAFKKEHHTAWYKLLINTDGNLSFDIVPEKPGDDYDFMLFRAGLNFCDSLVKNKLKPVRANISRDKTELSGKTGLSIKAKQELVKEGVNDAFSTPIKVAKGEVYYLVLDNVYENGGGHTIEFFYEQKVNVKGLVKNDEGKALITHVSITDLKGVSLAETTSNAKPGEYEIHTVLRKNCSYSINYYNDSSFVYSKTITLKDSIALKNIRTVLPKLKKRKEILHWRY